jgi:hypothetical protein
VIPAPAPPAPPAPPVGGQFPNQPAGFARITQHSGDPWPSGWWKHDAGTITAEVVPGQPTQVPSVRYRLPIGLNGGSGPGMMGYGAGGPGHEWNMRVGGQPVREIYVRFYIKYSEGWQQPASGQSKLFYTYQMSNRGRNVLHPNLEGLRAPFPTSVTSEIEGAVQNLYANRADVRIQPGVWYMYELYSRAASVSGASDGIVRWWINGTLVGEHVNIKRSHVPFTEWHGNPVWGGGGGVVEREQYIHFNHIYISGK